jgi:hypothetical protein
MKGRAADDDFDGYPRAKRIRPLTKDEFALLTGILTMEELVAVMELQSATQRAAVGRQLMKQEQLN